MATVHSLLVVSVVVQTLCCSSIHGVPNTPGQQHRAANSTCFEGVAERHATVGFFVCYKNIARESFQTVIVYRIHPGKVGRFTLTQCTPERKFARVVLELQPR
jgi:hypothetical protein